MGKSVQHSCRLASVGIARWNGEARPMYVHAQCNSSSKTARHFTGTAGRAASSGGSKLGPGSGHRRHSPPPNRDQDPKFSRPSKLWLALPNLAVLWTHCDQLILRKVSKSDVTQMSDFKAKMHKIRFPLGLRPKPRWGSLQRPRPPSPSCI